MASGCAPIRAAVNYGLEPFPLAVFESRVPVGAAARGSAIENAPQRPHEVDVAVVLAGLGGDQSQLAAPEAVDALATTDEHVGYRELRSIE